MIEKAINKTFDLLLGQRCEITQCDGGMQNNGGGEAVFSVEYSQFAHFRKAAFLRLSLGVEFIKLDGDMTIITSPKTNI